MSWREAVFQHLKLPTNIANSSSGGGGSSSNNNNSNERRNFGAALQGNFYEDTIPSFSEVLRHGPPPELYDALDLLVEQGLGDPNVADRYRTTCRIRLQNMDWVNAFNEQKEKVKYHRGLVQQLNDELAELRERLNAVTNNPTAITTTSTTATGTTTATSTPLSNMAPIDDCSTAVETTLTNVETNDEDVETAEDDIVENGMDVPDTVVAATSTVDVDIDPVAAEKIRQARINNLQKMITQKTSRSIMHQYRVNGIVTKLNNLRKIGPVPPMEDDEFQKISEGVHRARPAITLAFANHARDLHSKMLERYQMLDSKTDLTKPHEWYLHARLHKRKIIYHGGPTNSGKTYQALQRLKVAEKGMYVGPLRLLAAEIWERLTAEGIYCNLLTGQEFRTVPFATHKAATVEMASLNEDFDVVVIDEIQMINDKERGFAWTRALLGLRCREIHVCGGLEATDVVQRLVEACGDEFELKKYDRFSELQIESDSLASIPDELGTYKNIQPGDCIVAFSRNDIFAIKREIETNTKHKCCVIYGSLPPSTRSEQARRFNDPESGYDVLVASDAIGMGLNLNIRRIILNSIFKNDGFNIVRLDHSSMKQISGRAGRRNSPFPNGCTFVVIVLIVHTDLYH
jgi:ATP-dependent RNA helicase SUPV3L1/SUV3